MPLRTKSEMNTWLAFTFAQLFTFKRSLSGYSNEQSHKESSGENSFLWAKHVRDSNAPPFPPPNKKTLSKSSFAKTLSEGKREKKDVSHPSREPDETVE